MKVYVAGPSREIARVREAARSLEAAGHEVVSRWHRTDVPPSDAPLPFGVRANGWAMNTCDIMGAEATLALTQEAGGFSVGTREDVCFALGAYAPPLPELREPKRPVIVVGEPGPGLAITECRVVPTLSDSLALLGALAGE